MTLIRPLVNSLVKSNVSSIGGGGVIPSDATLEHYYPFASNLTDSIAGDIGTLTRASTSTVTDINTGNPITYGIDEPAYNGLSGTGNAIGLGFGASPDDLQLDSSTWPVNDCWYYGEIEYEGITGSNGVYLSSEVDASNKTRVNINNSNEVIFQKTVLGASYQPTVTLPSINQGDVIEWGLKQSLWGMELYVAHNGVIYSDLSVTNGDDLPIAATCQVGNLAALTSPLNGYYSNVKTISGISPTFDQVRNIT